MTHYGLLTEYENHFKQALKEADVIMDTLDGNAETMEAQTRDGYTISEDVSLRLLKLQAALGQLATDLCLDLVDYARQAREEME